MITAHFVINTHHFLVYYSNAIFLRCLKLHKKFFIAMTGVKINNSKSNEATRH